MNNTRVLSYINIDHIGEKTAEIRHLHSRQALKHHKNLFEYVTNSFVFYSGNNFPSFFIYIIY